MFQKADHDRHRLQDEVFEVEKATKRAEEQLEHSRVETREAKYHIEVLAKKKKIIEERLIKTEMERNKALAQANKALEDLVNADKERLAAFRKYEAMEDKYQKADKERAVLGQKLKKSQETEKAAVIVREVVADKFHNAEEREIAALKEKELLANKLKKAEQEIECPQADHKEDHDALALKTQELATATKDIATLKQEQKTDRETIAAKTKAAAEALAAKKVAEKEKTDAVTAKNTAIKDRDAAKEAEEAAKDELLTYEGPRRVQNGLHIKSLVWGVNRVTDATSNETVLSRVLKGGNIEIEKLFPNDQAANAETKWLIIWYGVENKSHGKGWNYKLPIWAVKGSPAPASDFKDIPKQHP